MTLLCRLSALPLIFLAASAQSQGSQAPEPPSGVAPLGYYVGSWQGHGEIGGEKLASSFTCEWFSGGFQVICRGNESGPSGKRAFINIKSFDETGKSYSEYSASSMGETEYDRGGTLSGNTLVYLIDQDLGGKPARIRYTETRLSADVMTYRAEASIDGAPWKDMARGEIRKLRP